MHLSLLPSELLGVLLVSSAVTVRHALAGPNVNVALQASFNAPPYILELLLVTFKLQIRRAWRAYILQGNSCGRKLHRLFPHPRSNC